VSDFIYNIQSEMRACKRIIKLMIERCEAVFHRGESRFNSTHPCFNSTHPCLETDHAISQAVEGVHHFTVMNVDAVDTLHDILESGSEI
jgi:hypothetical protein